jgi:hypothetical protein
MVRPCNHITCRRPVLIVVALGAFFSRRLAEWLVQADAGCGFSRAAQGFQMLRRSDHNMVTRG